MSVGKPTYWMHLSAEPETIVSMLETLGAVNTDLQGGVLNQLSAGTQVPVIWWG